jgi:glutathione peroxidase
MSVSFLLLSFFFFAPKPQYEVPASIYDFKVTALDGGTIDFAQFKGKKILIVNTASKCGFTPQYKALQAISEKYRDRLVIVGFPSNDFFRQEPGNDQKIANFCKENYGVTFPMAAKIDVKGRNMAPIYLWLTQKKYNNYSDSKVKWNFQKYLINEKGYLVGIFKSSTPPDAPEVLSAIEK